MIYSQWNGLQLSRLMLGTVQFGMRYGIANQTGQPSYADIRRITAAAIEGGVNCFDTAAAYGTSEELLGRALSELGCSDQVVVATKVRALTAEERASSNMAEAAILESVDQSRIRLRQDCLPIVLFHRESDAVYLDVLRSLRDRGWLKYCGVSCDNQPGNAERFVESNTVSALQIPGNVLDHRHQNSGIFQLSQQRQVAVFIRSVYLQGLLIMAESEIPESLRAVVPARRIVEKIADDAGITLPELSLRYMLSQSGVTSVLTGVETVDQVKENLDMFARGPLSADVLSAIELAELTVSDRILTPALWSQPEDSN